MKRLIGALLAIIGALAALLAKRGRQLQRAEAEVTLIKDDSKVAPLEATIKGDQSQIQSDEQNREKADEALNQYLKSHPDSSGTGD